MLLKQQEFLKHALREFVGWNEINLEALFGLIAKK